MTVLDKIRAFFKWYRKWYQKVSKPEAKGTGKKSTEPPETKVAEAPEKKGDEGSFSPKNR